MSVAGTGDHGPKFPGRLSSSDVPDPVWQAGCRGQCGLRLLRSGGMFGSAMPGSSLLVTGLWFARVFEEQPAFGGGDRAAGGA